MFLKVAHWPIAIKYNMVRIFNLNSEDKNRENVTGQNQPDLE